ncbi:MAG TPA: hypothetical protein VIL11_07830 [Limnochordales bacterium]
MASGVSLVIFEGGAAPSPAERMLAGLRRAVVQDTLERARQVALIERVLVVTDSEELAEDARARGAEVDLDAAAGQFHFGRRLAEVVRRHRLHRVMYMSGGLGALATPDDLRWVARELVRRPSCLITNNPYSADLVAFCPGEAVERIEPPQLDNSLAMALSAGAGLPLVTPPRTLGLHFDIDTPAEMLVLAVHPGAGPHARRYLQSQALDLARVRRVLKVLADCRADLLLFGRIGAPLFHYLDDRTRCRLRVLSEERGMKALGRDVRGEVTSLLGYLWEAVGSEGLFQRLAHMAQGALVDSRVLFAHRRWDVSQADRFLSDLGEWEEIGHPGVREFTRAAAEAGIPVLLGGHSLVSGGIWALVDVYLRGGATPVTKE